MRRRLVLSTLAVVIVVVALLGVPLAILGAHTEEDDARLQVRVEADKLIRVVDLELDAGQPVSAATLGGLVSADRYAKVTLAGGGRDIELGHPVSNDDPITISIMGERGEVVVVAEDRGRLDDRVRRIRLLVLVISLVAVLTAIALALLLARRLAGPLVDLARTAEGLGSGVARPNQRRYGVPELDRVAEVLDASAARVAAMLAAERQLAADASHQLRTPLTALSMRLEEIAATDDTAVVQEEAAVALGQVERLAGVVDRLLARAGEAGTAVPVDLDAAIHQQVEEWRPAYDMAKRGVEVAGQQGLMASATPGGIAQALATLLENSLVHGAGLVTVRTRRAGDTVVVEVTDEGPGVPPHLGSRIFERSVSGRASTGLGLALARDLAESDGGRLELVQQRPPVFALFLSAAPVPPG